MTVAFRNVDVAPGDPVSTWPYEALATVLDRGLVPDWRPVLAELRREPWGPVSRRVERILSYEELPGASPLFRRAIAQARQAADDRDRRTQHDRQVDAGDRLHERRVGGGAGEHLTRSRGVGEGVEEGDCEDRAAGSA